MLSAFLGQVGSYFDKRFLFNVWFPSFLFSSAGVVVAAIAMEPQVAINTWSALPTLTQAWLSVGGLVLVTFFAYICDNLLGTMIRLYEAYWPEWAQGLRRSRSRSQRRQWQYLNDRLDLIHTRLQNMNTATEGVTHKPVLDQTPASSWDQLQMCVDQFSKRLRRVPKIKEEMRASELVSLFHKLQALRGDILSQCERDPLQQIEWKGKNVQIENEFSAQCHQERKRLESEYNRLYDLLYHTFPQDSGRLMPTRLGNVLRAAEEYSQRVYNIDAPTTWPRLIPLMPTEFQAHLKQSSIPLTTMLLTATLSFAFAVVGGSSLFLLGGDRWWLFSSTVVGGIFLSVWCYESAVHRAIEYGVLIRTAFDLYRHELLKAISVPMPSSPLEEWNLWPQLMQWWHFHTPPFDAIEGKPFWHYTGEKPASSSPKRNEHVLYLKLGDPSEESGKK